MSVHIRPRICKVRAKYSVGTIGFILFTVDGVAHSDSSPHLPTASLRTLFQLLAEVLP